MVVSSPLNKVRWHPAPWRRYGQCRQAADTLPPADISGVGRVLPTLFMQGIALSNHAAPAGVEGWRGSCPRSKGVCAIGCCCQMTWTPSVPGSPPEPWHHLWSSVCYWWLGESLYGRVIDHLSYCLNKALLSGFITPQTTCSYVECSMRHVELELCRAYSGPICLGEKKGELPCLIQNLFKANTFIKLLEFWTSSYRRAATFSCLCF